MEGPGTGFAFCYSVRMMESDQGQCKEKVPSISPSLGYMGTLVSYPAQQIADECTLLSLGRQAALLAQLDDVGFDSTVQRLLGLVLESLVDMSFDSLEPLAHEHGDGLG